MSSLRMQCMPRRQGSNRQLLEGLSSSASSGSHSPRQRDVRRGVARHKSSDELFSFGNGGSRGGGVKRGVARRNSLSNFSCSTASETDSECGSEQYSTPTPGEPTTLSASSSTRIVATCSSAVEKRLAARGIAIPVKRQTLEPISKPRPVFKSTPCRRASIGGCAGSGGGRFAEQPVGAPRIQRRSPIEGGGGGGLSAEQPSAPRIQRRSSMGGGSHNDASSSRASSSRRTSHEQRESGQSSRRSSRGSSGLSRQHSMRRSERDDSNNDLHNYYGYEHSADDEDNNGAAYYEYGDAADASDYYGYDNGEEAQGHDDGYGYDASNDPDGTDAPRRRTTRVPRRESLARRQFISKGSP